LRRPRWPQLFNRLPNRFSYGHPYPLRMKELNGKIVAIRKNGEAIITRLRMISKDLALGIPDNPDSIDETVVLRGDEIWNSVIGKVSWWWGRQR